MESVLNFEQSLNFLSTLVKDYDKGTLKWVLFDVTLNLDNAPYLFSFARNDKDTGYTIPLAVNEGCTYPGLTYQRLGFQITKQQASELTYMVYQIKEEPFVIHRDEVRKMVSKLNSKQLTKITSNVNIPDWSERFYKFVGKCNGIPTSVLCECAALDIRHARELFIRIQRNNYGNL